ncbi:hypothetical protein [Vibrio sp. HN007]|uniref:hypothetical protein n=1 Tax=Vibrio iocasae TaxID=3098914 RepID=UPI0035D4D9C2
MSHIANFVLPRMLTIYEVAGIYSELVLVISQTDALHLHGTEVEELDGAGLQLILWSRLECQKANKGWSIVSSSKELSQSLSLLSHSLKNDIHLEDA